MRLIDADELKKALKSNCDTLCNDKNTNWCEHCCPLNDFEDLIDNAPNADDWQKYSDELWKNITLLSKLLCLLRCRYERREKQ